MLITVPIQGSLTTGKESCFCIALWVEFSQKESVIRTVGQKGNIVFLGHGMLDGEKEFVLYVFHTKHMRLIRGFCFQGRQRDPAAGNGGSSAAMQDIPADRTGIEL